MYSFSLFFIFNKLETNEWLFLKHSAILLEILVLLLFSIYIWNRFSLLFFCFQYIRNEISLSEKFTVKSKYKMFFQGIFRNYLFWLTFYSLPTKRNYNCADWLILGVYIVLYYIAQRLPLTSDYVFPKLEQLFSCIYPFFK